MIERKDLKSIIKDSSENWAINNPSLPIGFIAYETNTNKIKVFNGEDSFNDLPYVSRNGEGSAGVSYIDLSNKPQINSVELTGNKTLDQLGIQAKGNYATFEQISEKADISDIPTKTSELVNDSGFLSSIPNEYITETELTAKNYATTSALTEGLAEKANTSALPASTSLMNGTAPTVADFAGTDIDNLKIELNAFLAQLKTRGVIV